MGAPKQVRRAFMLGVLLFWVLAIVQLNYVHSSTNYICADAIPILLNSTTPLDDTGALPDIYPTCASDSTRYFLWYSYAASEPVSLIQATTLQQRLYDMVLEVFSNCTDFPATPLDCSYAPPIVNFKAIPGQTYYLGVGGFGPADLGTGLLSIAPAQLTLILETQQVYNGGGFPMIYTVDAVGVPPFNVTLEISCGSSSISSSEVTTSLTPQTLESPQLPPGNCTMLAYDPDIPSLLSNTQNFIAYGLIVQLPVGNSIIDAGTPFDIQIDTNDPRQNYTVNATVTCSEANVTQVFEVTTNATFSGAQLDPAAWGLCYVTAASALMISTNSTQIIVKTQLTISAPVNNSIISTVDDYAFLVSAVSTATDQPATVSFFPCLIYVGVMRFPVAVNQASLGEIPYWYAGDTCNVAADGSNFIESPQIQVSFWNPLSLNNATTNLQGWTGGSTVSVQIDALSGRAITVDLFIGCPVTSWLTTLTTNSLQLLQLPPGLNGINCTMSTVNLPELALPITPVTLDIGIGREGAGELADVLQFAAFVDCCQEREDE